MPFLDEQELTSLQQEIHDANVKKDEIEIELNQVKEKLNDSKRRNLGINLFFATLAGFAIAGALFLYQQKNNGASINSLSESNIDTEAIREEITAEVLDSIANVTSEVNENMDSESDNIKSIDEDIESINDNTRNQEVYSVQIGVFSEKKHAVLSKTLAGIVASQGDIFKYSLGLFKTKEEAQKFRKSLVAIGFEDAFIAAYVNGKRKRIVKPN